MGTQRKTIVVSLRGLLSPQLKHYRLLRDGRDEIVKYNDEMMFYRDGSNVGSWSHVALPSKADPSNIQSSHKLVPLKKYYCIAPYPNLDFHDYYKRHSKIKVFWDDGKVTHKAKIYPDTATIYLNRHFIEKLPWAWRIYVLFHEIAHLWTHEEPDTDVWASYLYVTAGYPPSQAAMCLKYTLSDDNPEKQERRERAVRELLAKSKIYAL